MKKTHLVYLVRAALSAALIFLGIYIIKIPIPVGYIHFGDGFIYATAALLPPVYAAAAAAVGGFLSDLLAGYGMYAPWTAVIKALMAIPVTLLCRNNGFIARLRGAADRFEKRDLLPVLLSVVVSGVINVGGYFLADSTLFDTAAAAASLPLNAVHSVAGIIIFFLAVPLVAKAFKK